MISCYAVFLAHSHGPLDMSVAVFHTGPAAKHTWPFQLIKYVIVHKPVLAGAFLQTAMLIINLLVLVLGTCFKRTLY